MGIWSLGGTLGYWRLGPAGRQNRRRQPQNPDESEPPLLGKNGQVRKEPAETSGDWGCGNLGLLWEEGGKKR